MCQVSVIVPVYNMEKYIRKCVESLLQQIYDDYEIIIVDDGSTDRSIEMIRDLLSDSKIKLIQKQNEGTSQARKTGFEASQGKYIVFVDSDDWVEPDMLQKMKSAAVHYDADVVCICTRKEREDGTLIDELNLKETSVFENIEERISAYHNGNAINPVLWNKLFERELLERIEFPKGLLIGEDYTMIVPIMECARRVVHIPYILYHYVIHGNNITRGKFDEISIRTFYNYQSIRNELLKKYPSCQKDIDRFHIIEEMACLNRMIRAGQYDAEIKEQIICDIRKNICWFIRRNCISRIYRCSAALIALNAKLYSLVYKMMFRILKYE